MTYSEREEIMNIHVKINEEIRMSHPEGASVVMILFSGHATGAFFEGDILNGGVDTQMIGKGGSDHHLSARYMLRGNDHTGQSCEIYIENNGKFDSSVTDVLFRTTPRLFTNSSALSFLNDSILIGEGLPSEDGVKIVIYRQT
ncbi:DUF3237 family protein [Saccharibacillus sp. JS10]|uniref:DUF3237 family protein n=1 Tax=Saccharibacillus sp. JS10 TaxID=2950552 RepID=UPI00210D5FFC|nr:DUF3237 family protein [Saccharibacillus sp. JS10]MCQ4087838.1 DUF3237 domain-containing protein [Saccharibacillus sp. JS10]